MDKPEPVKLKFKYTRREGKFFKNGSYKSRNGNSHGPKKFSPCWHRPRKAL